MRALRFLLALPLLTVGGCTLLVNDRVDPLEPDPMPDMQLQLTGFDPHIGQLTELRLINSDEGAERRIVQAVAIYDPLPAPDVLVLLDNVVRPDHRRVDFYSDLRENRRIDPPEEDPEDESRLLFPDHMWRITLAEDGTGEFRHSTDFTDIVNDDRADLALGDMRLSITGADPFVDQPAQVWVTDPLDRDVGYYFLGSITGDAIDITIPGIIDDGSEYIVTFKPGDAPPRCVVASGDDEGLTIEEPLGSLPECQ